MVWAHTGLFLLVCQTNLSPYMWKWCYIWQHSKKKSADSLRMYDYFCKVPGFPYHIIASNDQFPDSFRSTASKPCSIPFLLTCLELLAKTNLTQTIFVGNNELTKRWTTTSNTNWYLRTPSKNYLTLIVFHKKCSI